MNPVKLECIRLAIQAGAREDVVSLAKEIEAFISVSNSARPVPRQSIRQKDRVGKRG